MPPILSKVASNHVQAYLPGFQRVFNSAWRSYAVAKEMGVAGKRWRKRGQRHECPVCTLNRWFSVCTQVNHAPSCPASEDFFFFFLLWFSVQRSRTKTRTRTRRTRRRSRWRMKAKRIWPTRRELPPRSRRTASSPRRRSGCNTTRGWVREPRHTKAPYQQGCDCYSTGGWIFLILGTCFFFLPSVRSWVELIREKVTLPPAAHLEIFAKKKKKKRKRWFFFLPTAPYLTDIISL